MLITTSQKIVVRGLPVLWATSATKKLHFYGYDNQISYDPGRLRKQSTYQRILGLSTCYNQSPAEEKAQDPHLVLLGDPVYGLHCVAVQRCRIMQASLQLDRTCELLQEIEENTSHIQNGRQ